MFILDPLVLARYFLAGLFGMLLLIFFWAYSIDSKKLASEKKETNQNSKYSNWLTRMFFYYLLCLIIYLIIYYYFRWKFFPKAITD